MRGKQIIEEIDFLRSQGEGLERITEVIQQQATITTPSLKRLMLSNNRQDLIDFLFPKAAPVVYEHGEIARYAQGCRCALCREANTDKAAKYRKERVTREKDPEDPRHGMGHFYRNHGCRCEPCTTANNADWVAGYRNRRK